MRAINYGKVEESSSLNRLPSTARFAATSAILMVTLSRSDRPPTSATSESYSEPGGPCLPDVTKVCCDVLHFLHEGGSYVSESQRCKACSANRSPASPTRAGRFQNHLVRRCRLETVPSVPTFRRAGRRRGSALGEMCIRDRHYIERSHQ